MTKLRLAFMGTPDFAVPSLEALRAAGHDIAAVYSQPPRPAGRGQRPQPSPVQQAAEAAHLPVHSPARLDAAAIAAFAAFGLDAAVVAAYGLILPKPVLAAPRLGCLNVHASLLPRWRGAAPGQRAILAGDSETGITIMQMEEGLDTGAVLLAEAGAIRPTTPAQQLPERLAAVAGPPLVTGRAASADPAARRAGASGCRCLPARLSAAARHRAAMSRYKLTVEYDGGGLVGWQRQANGLSVQEVLEIAVERFCGEAVTVHGAGRTDAGVHALAQTAHLDLPREASPEIIRNALNHHAKPAAVSVLAVELVPASFDARRSARGRVYRC